MNFSLSVLVCLMITKFEFYLSCKINVREETLPTSLPPNCNMLDVSGNKMVTIPCHAFENLTKTYMERMIFDDNILETICPGVFVGLRKVKRLYLNNNKLSFIANNTFLGLADLEILQMSGNRLETLHRNMFNGLPKVKFLTINDNGIRYIETGAFDHLLAVIEIKLSYNNLKCIPSNTFAGLEHLARINLRHNFIHTLEASALLLAQRHLAKIYLENNELTSLSWSIFGFGEMRHRKLYLDNNNFTCGLELCWVFRYHSQTPRFDLKVDTERPKHSTTFPRQDPKCVSDRLSVDCQCDKRLNATCYDEGAHTILCNDEFLEMSN